VLVDEAQNFHNEPGEDWFQEILTILKSRGSDYDNISLYIFCDELQKIRREYCGLRTLDSTGERQETLTAEFFPKECKLSTVIRNSIQIYKEWEKFALKHPDFKQKNHLTIGHDYLGGDVNYIEISSDHENEIFSKVEETIRQILDEKSYKASDVAVLFNKKDIAGEFRKHLIPLFAELNIPVTDAEEFPRKGLVVDSFRRFSGLEAPVVIAVLPKPIPYHENADEVNILLYSRAMVELHIIYLHRN
jgi:hypothetical protein